MIKLHGPWKNGYAFDIHTLESIYLGDNQYGHPTFDTKRSEMGQFLYDLKYGQHLPVLEKIVELLKSDDDFRRFISTIDIILPVPPSNNMRRIQPVLVCSNKLAEEFSLEIKEDVLSSTNKEELKNTPSEEKYDKIKKSIRIDPSIGKGKRILIFDDVFDSGSTLTALTRALAENGYTSICVFTLTKTRKAD